MSTITAMKIYFSCSLTGGRNDQPVYAAIVEFLLAAGHEVLTAALARPEVLDVEAAVSPNNVYDRDVAWVQGCDVLVAEVSTPSHGVGYEIALALNLGKPVLCVYRTGARVSKMILGNRSPGLVIFAYTAMPHLLAELSKFLGERSGGLSGGI